VKDMKDIEQKLEDYMQIWSESNRFSGTIVITHCDRYLLRKGYGYANHEYQIPNEASTIYNIGSITKQFTAAAVLQQVENGNLRLDDFLGTFLPDYKHACKITIHHMMASTSGIPDYTAFPQYNTRDRLSVDTIIEWLNAKPLDCIPGQSVQKSNSNFVLLARIVEIVSGMEIESYFKKYLYEPAGLQFTGVSHNVDVISNKAYGYSVSGEGVVQAEYYDLSGSFGSGFLHSNADDLLKWTKALTEGRIISKESYQKMITPNGFLWYMGASIGYGCSVNGDPVDKIAVEGNIYGYTCCIQQYLKDDFTVIVLSNNDAVPTGRIVKGIESILLSQETQIIVKPDMHDNVDYRKYIPFIGEYHFPPTGWRFAINFEDGCLNVDRLFIQQSKRKKFALKLVSDQADLVILACEVCDSTFFFHKDSQGRVSTVIYVWDTIELPYEPMGDVQSDK
jgi:CubicO group peptidase (beta-lactamase class C family)